MKESNNEIVISFLRVQRFERLRIIEKEYKDVLERVVIFNVFYVVVFEELLFDYVELEVLVEENIEFLENKLIVDFLNVKLKLSGGRINWNELVEKLFKKKEFEEVV